MYHNGTGSRDAAPTAPPPAEQPDMIGATEPDAGGPSQDAGATLQGAGGTLQGAGSPLQGAGSPLQGAGSPLQGAGGTLQGAGGTLQGAGSPLQGAGGTLQGAGGPLQPEAPIGQRRVATFTTNASIERRLLAAQLTIDGVLADPVQQAALDACGYDLAQLQHGKQLYEEALAHCQQRHATFGDQLTATDVRDQTKEQAHARYMGHVVIARVALRGDRGAAQKLDLSARKRTQAGWLLQARQFYTNALGDASIIERLARYRLTSDQLLEGQRQVALVSAEAVRRQSRKKIAKQTKEARDGALDALNEWMRDFRAIAHVALADQPQARTKPGS